MGKYYVQSGTVRTVVEAESRKKAALWAIHQTMQQIIPLDDDATAGQPDGCDGRPFGVLSTRVRVSERGFDRDDAADLPTLDVVNDWNHMITTLDRLERMLYRAA